MPMLSAQKAAAAIVRLINSSPRSPRPEEIEAIIAHTGSSPAQEAVMSPGHAAHYREWRGLIDQHMREFEHADATGMMPDQIKAEERRMGAHMEAISALAQRIFAVPARTWGDVALYAQCCCWYHWAGVDPEGPGVQAQLECGPMSSADDDNSLGKLLEAIFTVAGIGSSREAKPC